MVPKKSLSTSNQKIISFYEQHPWISFEEMNLRLIEVFDKVLESNTSVINETISNQILERLVNQNTEMQTIIKTMDDLFRKYKDDTQIAIEKNIEKTTLKNENIMMKGFEQYDQNLEQYNQRFVDKIRLCFNDMIPEISKEQQHVLNSALLQIDNSLKTELNRYNESDKQLNDLLNKRMELDSTNISEIKNEIMKSKESNMEKYLDELSNKITNVMPMIQNALMTNLNDSENRLNDKLSEHNMKIQQNSELQNQVFNELNEFLNKYKKSSNKGSYSENRLEKILNELFPSGRIENTTSLKVSTDFHLYRDEKELVLIENKEYDNNVKKEEVVKFVRDCDDKKCHGIFISHSSGIQSKQHFQIDNNNGKFLIYIHNCEYNPTIIKTAIDIIDHLGKLYGELDEKEKGTMISDNVFNEITNEYRQMVATRQTLLNTIHDFEKKLTQQALAISLPNLEKIIKSKDSISSEKTHTCEICGTFVTYKLSSLSAHKRHCKKNMDN